MSAASLLRAERFYLEAAAAIIKSQQPPDPTAPMTRLAWAEKHRRIDGHPFSLDRFLPLQAIYADEHPHIVIGKPAQRGASELAINYAAFALDRGADVWAPGAKNGLNVGYVFPTQTALSAFSKERVAGMKRETLYLSLLFGSDDGYDDVGFKQIRDSYLYLRGGWSEAGLVSFAADLLVLDEYDRMDPKAIALARRRLNASIVKRELDLSTPTVPGVGIHDLYLQSDRHVYEQQHACGRWVTFDFFRDVRVAGETYEVPGGKGWRTWTAHGIRSAAATLHCPSCELPLSDEERTAPGRWRAEAPEVQGLRGYWLPWWPWPVVDLLSIAATAVSQDPSELTELFRSDLGLPYVASGSRITREMLSALSHDLDGGVLPDGPWRSPTMGLDVGSRFHYRISSLGPDGATYVRAMGSVATWAEVDVLMTVWRIRLCVVDALPEQHGARAFVDRHPGKAVTATYPTANALKGVLVAPADPADVLEAGRVSINRTMALDAVFAAVATGAERWPAAIHNDPEVVSHMTAMVRVETIDPHGQPRADWVHTMPDHLMHSSLYDRVARLLLAGQATSVPLPLMQGTVKGW